MQSGIKPVVRHALVAKAPGILPTGDHLPVQLHDGRQRAELRPALEKVRRRRAPDFRAVLISADVAAPNRKTTHRRRLTGDHYARQTVFAEVRLVVARPAGGIRL